MTSFLVVDNRLSSTVSDLNGAIRLGLKICAHRSDSVQLLLNGVKASSVPGRAFGDGVWQAVRKEKPVPFAYNY